jgi:hypothetical protein
MLAATSVPFYDYNRKAVKAAMRAHPPLRGTPLPQPPTAAENPTSATQAPQPANARTSLSLFKAWHLEAFVNDSIEHYVCCNIGCYQVSIIDWSPSPLKECYEKMDDPMPKQAAISRVCERCTAQIRENDRARVMLLKALQRIRTEGNQMQNMEQRPEAREIDDATSCTYATAQENFQPQEANDENVPDPSPVAALWAWQRPHMIDDDSPERNLRAIVSRAPAGHLLDAFVLAEREAWTDMDEREWRESCERFGLDTSGVKFVPKFG